MVVTDTIRYIYYLMIFRSIAPFIFNMVVTSSKGNGYSGYHEPIGFDYYFAVTVFITSISILCYNNTQY